MNDEARQIISQMAMKALPGEGGFFAPTWTSTLAVSSGRALGSAILFLITPEDFSALHRLGMDEVWHFHSGDPAELVLMGPGADACHVVILGPEVAKGHAPQAAVRAGQWQGARIGSGGRGWALFGCVVTPAWDERDFELGRRDALLADFPAHGDLIRRFTR